MKAQFASWVRWWLDGLAWFLPQFLRHRAPGAGEQLHVAADASGRLHISDTGSGGIAVAPLLPDGELPAAGAIPEAVREAIGKECEIILLLPAAMTLSQRLRLPVAAAPELRQVLGFEVERRTPFRQEEVYFDHRELAHDRKAASLEVEFRLVPKSAVDPLLDTLRSWGLAAHRIDTADARGRPAGWNLLPRALRPAATGYGHSLARALAALAVVLLLTNLYLSPLHKALQAGVLERKLAIHAQATARLQALRAEYATLRARSNFVAGRRNQRPPVIALLAELTRLLPDDSWLERLSLEGDELQLQGQSSKPAALIQQIESSAYFDKTQFRAPITRNDRTLRDHFHISTRLTSGPPSRPI